MKFKTIIITFLLLGISSLLSITYAHVGGGPPFLSINGKYADTNPFFSNDPTINVPQDTNPYTNPIIVNEPIHFIIDTGKLLVPPDIAENTIYRWSFSENSKEYRYGKTITYAYKKSGSFLITIDAKAPGESDFITIDTLQVNILPHKNYKIPKAILSVETTNRHVNKPIYFKANVTTDNSAKIEKVIWGFGDETSATTTNALHTYKNMNNFSTYPVIFRVIDSNGFITDSGIIVQSKNKTLHFYNEQGKENTIKISNTITQQKTFPYLPLAIVINIGGLLLICSYLFFRWKKFQNTNPK